MNCKIVGIGNISILDYFCAVSRPSLETRYRVIYGGARLKRYGAGFKSVFYDMIGGLPVQLYVEPEKMKPYRFRKHIWSILDHQEEVAYFKVYALGTLQRSPTSNTLNVIVGPMRHVCIILGPKRSKLHAQTELIAAGELQKSSL